MKQKQKAKQTNKTPSPQTTNLASIIFLLPFSSHQHFALTSVAFSGSGVALKMSVTQLFSLGNGLHFCLAVSNLLFFVFFLFKFFLSLCVYDICVHVCTCMHVSAYVCDYGHMYSVAHRWRSEDKLGS